MTQDQQGPSSTSTRSNTYHLAGTAAILLVLIATVVYRMFEDWSWVDSLYFSVIAVTTVGFGDLAPTTDVTKLFTICYLIAGMTIVGVVLNERLRRHHAGLEWMARHAPRRRLESPEDGGDQSQPGSEGGDGGS